MTFEMPPKLYNHGFEKGDMIEYGLKTYIVIEEHPNFLYVEDLHGVRYELWSKQLAVKH